MAIRSESCDSFQPAPTSSPWGHTFACRISALTSGKDLRPACVSTVVMASFQHEHQTIFTKRKCQCLKPLPAQPSPLSYLGLFVHEWCSTLLLRAAALPPPQASIHLSLVGCAALTANDGSLTLDGWLVASGTGCGRPSVRSLQQKCSQLVVLNIAKPHRLNSQYISFFNRVFHVGQRWLRRCICFMCSRLSLL